MAEPRQLFAYGIFKVIYAPHKAFKEIIQKPRYIGPLLIMLLFVLANIGFGYSLLSKTYYDQTQPRFSDFDRWTNETNFWTSNASIALNTQDYISGTYYGNQSIEFSIVDSSQVWTQLNTSDSVNCSGPEGYKSLSFRLKLKSIEPLANPSNVSLYMISSSLQDTFYQDITNQINQTGVWINLTIALGDESEGWLKNANANWGDVTGLKLDLMWPTESNMTLLIDGLFFHGLYKSGIEIASGVLISLNNPYSPINAFMQFIIQWVILGGVLYLVPKMFGIKTVWKPLLIIAGFILIAYLIRAIAFTAVDFASPEIRYTFEYMGGVPGEWETASTQVFQPFDFYYQILWYIDKLVLVWTGALCALALHLMFALSWTKSVLASLLVEVLYILILLFMAPAPIILS